MSEDANNTLRSSDVTSKKFEIVEVKDTIEDSSNNNAVTVQTHDPVKEERDYVRI